MTSDAKSVGRQFRLSTDTTTSLLAPASGVGQSEHCPLWARSGAVALFALSSIFGVLEVHSSTDTWIALAAGRQILASQAFPKTDAFSYTFFGQTWFNQNWLSHVFLWVMYDRAGPNAVALCTWALGLGLFALVLLATRLRCGSWFGATLAAAVVAAATRDWLSPRPATVQFFLLASLVLALQAWLADDAHKRWWPLAVVAPVLLVWPHAHGSFILGLALTGVFIACGVCAKLLKMINRKTTTDDLAAHPSVMQAHQLLALTIVLALTATLAAALSPYGLQNYIHPLTIAESRVFRQVGEWLPPWRRLSIYPPVFRFWAMFGLAAFTLAVALWLRHRQALRGRRSGPVGAHPRHVATNWHAGLFDATTTAAGLALALSARRFAPMLPILVTPTFLTLVRRITGPLDATGRSLCRVLGAAAWAGSMTIAVATVYLAKQEMVDTFPAGERFDLLDRVTRADTIVRPALEFLRRNGLTASVFTDWKQAGPLFFHVPQARVFIDGRAQQVYSERHYLIYKALLAATPDQADLFHQQLVGYGTDAVLLPKWRQYATLVDLLDRHPGWLRVVECSNGILWVRGGTALFDEVARRERQNDLWWPDLPETMLARGLLWVRSKPSDPLRAVELWKEAVARDPLMGFDAYGWIVRATRSTPYAGQTAAYLQAEAYRVKTLPGLTAEQRRSLLDVLSQCQQHLGP